MDNKLKQLTDKELDNEIEAHKTVVERIVDEEKFKEETKKANEVVYLPQEGINEVLHAINEIKAILKKK